MGREYSPAIDMFVDEQRVFIGALNDPSDFSIVLHGTGSPGSVLPTAQEIALYFATNQSMVSSHFVIGRDGTVIQCVSLKDGAAANCCVETVHDSYWDKYVQKYGNLNKCTISIEHVNNGDNSLPLTPQQQTASFKLIQWLSKRYNIPTNRIKTHASIDPQARAHCPGNYPLKELIQSMATKTTQPTISETEIQSDLTEIQNDIIDEEKKLAELRGMIIVNKPTVIE